MPLVETIPKGVRISWTSPNYDVWVTHDIDESWSILMKNQTTKQSFYHFNRTYSQLEAILNRAIPTWRNDKENIWQF